MGIFDKFGILCIGLAAASPFINRVVLKPSSEDSSEMENLATAFNGFIGFLKDGKEVKNRSGKRKKHENDEFGDDSDLDLATIVAKKKKRNEKASVRADKSPHKRKKLNKQSDELKNEGMR